MPKGGRNNVELKKAVKKPEKEEKFTRKRKVENDKRSPIRSRSFRETVPPVRWSPSDEANAKQKRKSVESRNVSNKGTSDLPKVAGKCMGSKSVA